MGVGTGGQGRQSPHGQFSRAANTPGHKSTKAKDRCSGPTSAKGTGPCPIRRPTTCATEECDPPLQSCRRPLKLTKSFQALLAGHNPEQPQEVAHGMGLAVHPSRRHGGYSPLGISRQMSSMWVAVSGGFQTAELEQQLGLHTAVRPDRGASSGWQQGPKLGFWVSGRQALEHRDRDVCSHYLETR